MELQEYSLRERKHAKTKIDILNAFIRALENSQFDDISIRRICREVDISEGTFFNYFSEKLEIINYYTHLIFLRVIWRAQREVPREKFPDFIEAVFSNLSEDLINANIIYKMISVMLVQQEEPKKVIISELERKMFLPDCPGIEDVPAVFPSLFFKTYLEEAFKRGDIPKGIKAKDLAMSLNTILMGTLLAVKFDDLNSKGYHYLRQLHLLWKGLGIEIPVRKK